MRIAIVLIFLSSLVYGQDPGADFKIFGCLPVKGDFLFASETEVTNFNYLEFLFDQRKNKGEAYYKTMLPDTTAWNSSRAFNEPYVEYYLRHPAYRDYPVVNITRFQVLEYCEWLEGKLNAHYDTLSKHPVVKVDVRLPTAEEWSLAAQGGNAEAIFPWSGTGMRHTAKKWEGDMMANFVRGRGDYMGIAGSLNDNADVTAPVFSYWPNGYGLYNMSGNVAEMVQEEGITKGGSWRNRAPYLEINGADPNRGFVAASPEIGFRYFVEVLDTRAIKVQKKKRFSTKMIEELLVSIIEDSLLSSKYEVTNELYSIFISENQGNGFEPKDELWLQAMPYSRRYVNDYSSDARYANHPVVNISREGAEAFCSWLEERYNGMSKKKYKKLEIKLPSLKEWEFVAAGDLQLSEYPWGGPYARNARGKWLCNFNPVEERWVLDLNDSTYLRSGITKEQIQGAAGQDGYMVTAPVDAYHPNNYGVYGASGNVAEMISDQDVVKGGSWGSMVYDTKIRAQEAYQGASPYVGFRFIAILK
ncbi:MAG: SUMF1/EgtB/PvdO family nonheme iron enzyme [Flavobacteriales bacterium]|nr:SUMF1/EgtB/PvdO family nonheme iron enzyme [Flavobacteriales bacterium]